MMFMRNMGRYIPLMIIILYNNMFGVFVLPAKTDDKAYPYKKDPKKALNLSDEELVHFVRITPKMTYFCHYKTDYDAASVEDKLKVIEKFLDKPYQPLKKVRGIENAYQTEDGNYYIKVIVNNREWFNRYFN